MKKMQLEGQRFGKLLVVELDTNNSDRYSKWICICDCGNKTTVYGTNLKTGASKSCGCLGVTKRKAACATHGMSYSSEYHIWGSIKSRCLNTNNNAYHKYGGNGIGMCREWVKSFECFFNDMGKRPSKLFSIEKKITSWVIVRTTAIGGQKKNSQITEVVLCGSNIMGLNCHNLTG